MNLYYISRTDRVEYDQFAAAVVVAEDEEEARKIHPDEGASGREWWIHNPYLDWAKTLDDVVVEYIGIAAKGFISGDVICSDYRAG